MQKYDFLFFFWGAILIPGRKEGESMKDCQCRCRLPRAEEWQSELERIGMNSQSAEQFQKLLQQGYQSGALRLLRNHKQSLLGTLHQTQEQIDHLDFLVYALNTPVSKPDHSGTGK